MILIGSKQKFPSTYVEILLKYSKKVALDSIIRLYKIFCNLHILYIWKIVYNICKRLIRTYVLWFKGGIIWNMKEKLINAIKNHKLDHKHLNEVIKLAKEELNKTKD